MKAIGLKIKEFRLAKNLKQEELAKRIGAKSSAAVSSWEVGKAKPDCVTLLRICEVLDVSPDELLGYETETPSAAEWSLLKKYRYIDDLGKQAVDAVLAVEYQRAFTSCSKKAKARMLKLDYYSFAASAGTGNFLETETPEEIWVKETAEAEGADYVIPIKGDSMEPSYHDGDKVFVEKCDSIDLGEIGIFVINGEAFIKELGNKCLISHNEAYKPIKLNQSDSVFCCGRVLGTVEE